MNDPRFIRHGRTLAEWLPGLLGPDQQTRRRAENAISAMHWGAPVADSTVWEHVPKDLNAHHRDWGMEVARVLADPEFPGEQFVRQALVVIKQDQRRHDELLELEDKLFDPDEQLEKSVEDQIFQQVHGAELQSSADRLPNSHGEHTLRIVIENAGPILLRMPELVRRSLKESDLRRYIARAIGHIGPPAAMFIDDLLEFKDERGFASYPEALAAVARDDATLLRRIIDRHGLVKSADVLKRIGPRASELLPLLPDDLLALLADPDEQPWLAECAAKVAPHRRDVFERIAAMARPASPIMRTVEAFPDYDYDIVMFRRGAALEALGEFKAFAADATPVLVEGLNTFVEYNPDWDYIGEQARIVYSLSKLGPGAAAAVPALLSRLRAKDGDLNRSIIQFFGDVGPAAAQALPALREIRGNDPMPLSEPNRHASPFDWAMWQIEHGDDA